jgi:purine-nucleoside phosphorylase
MNKSEPDPKYVAEKVRRSCELRPRLGIILGTGFHHLAHELEVEAMIPFGKLPGFPRPGVRGHAGQLLTGRLAGTPVLVLSGRAHYYEGISMSLITFPVRVLAACGVTDLLLTNAAGGINPRLRAGDFLILSDHINLMGLNPLRGACSHPPFVDLSCAYDRGLRQLLQRAGKSAGRRLRRGVYLAVAGPSYETPAEIRAFRRLGADAVGMSTVPEAIVARQCGLRVAALSCITNLAAGMSEAPLSHAEVLAAGARVKDLAAQLIKHFARLYV